MGSRKSSPGGGVSGNCSAEAAGDGGVVTTLTFLWPGRGESEGSDKGENDLLGVRDSETELRTWDRTVADSNRRGYQ